MFNTEAKVATWTFSPGGRGKRSEPVSVGCYVIEHVATGKLITGVSESVSNDVDLTLLAISDQSLRNKKFVKLCVLDPDVRLYEYPTKTLRQAKQIEKEIRSSTTPHYLLLN
jgi:hypothetical protein